MEVLYLGKNIPDIILNSTRMRIIQEVTLKEKIIVGELCGILNDIPRTTLYRHVGILIDNNILNVVEENRVRGTIERTLSINVEELQKLSDGDLPKHILQILMSIYSRFLKYHESGNDPEVDKIFISSAVMMMSDDEFDNFLAEMHALSMKYFFESTPERKERNITVISAPEVIKKEEL